MNIVLFIQRTKYFIRRLLAKENKVLEEKMVSCGQMQNFKRKKKQQTVNYDWVSGTAI